MGENVIFVKPVDKVGVIYDILKSSTHSNYPVVDTDDNGVLYGTIGRNALVILLQRRAFGHPKTESEMKADEFSSNYLRIETDDIRYYPTVQWDVVEKAYPKYPSADALRISPSEREFVVDLRPYANRAPLTIQESSTVSRTYQLFRSLGLRFLPVVNRHNQCVGTITRSDLTPQALANTMLKKGKKRA